MKSILTYYLSLTTACLGAQSVGKSVVAIAGNTMTVSEVAIGYTIGEPIVGYIITENSIDQGFWAGSLQVENITGQKDLNGIAVYPNPVVDELTIFNDSNEIYGITLFGVDGRRVLMQTVEATQLEHKIDLSYLSKGVYVLRLLMKEDADEKLFKIIKN